MYLRNVKQKISAIILLISFIGILAHDMMPHHHHHDDSNSIALSTENHDHAECHAEHHAEYTNINTQHSESEQITQSDKHHCPHELHNCAVQVYDASRSISAEQASKKLSAQNVILTKQITCTPLTAEEICLHSEEIFDTRNLYLSNTSLRAPPVKA